MKKRFISSLMVLLLIVLLAAFSQVHADDGVTSCYTRTDAGVVFTFSNIPDQWLTETGWYFIGDDAALDGHTLTVIGLQFDEGYSYAVVGDNTYGESYTATTEISLECDEPKPTETPISDLSMATPESPAPVTEIRSTGRICTVHYPSLVIVCNGI